ncbi:hypothetical protein L7F22_053955 [Adiantum nelumboides]|nr:hypothetical protein [Adiantum nelumboides]
MPDSNAYENSIQVDTSASSKATSLHQSPETSWNGWDTDEKAVRGSAESGEPYQNCNADWTRIKGSNHEFKPFVSPMKEISRHRSEGDMRMLDSMEKHSMKHSESTPCISKRKRSFDAVRDDSDTEASKRFNQESGWE